MESVVLLAKMYYVLKPDVTFLIPSQSRGFVDEKIATIAPASAKRATVPCVCINFRQSDHLLCRTFSHLAQELSSAPHTQHTYAPTSFGLVTSPSKHHGDAAEQQSIGEILHLLRTQLEQILRTSTEQVLPCAVAEK